MENEKVVSTDPTVMFVARLAMMLATGALIIADAKREFPGDTDAYKRLDLWLEDYDTLGIPLKRETAIGPDRTEWRTERPVSLIPGELYWICGPEYNADGWEAPMVCEVGGGFMWIWGCEEKVPLDYPCLWGPKFERPATPTPDMDFTGRAI